MCCTQYRYHTLQPLTVFDFVFPPSFVWKRNYDAQRVARIQFYFERCVEIESSAINLLQYTISTERRGSYLSDLSLCV